MPQDVVTLHALTQELAAALTGGRIDRVTQPEKDEVCFYVRNKGRTQCLVVSANPNAPRMHLTCTKKDNPYAAPAFLMHLRRHFQGGMIQRVEVVNYDRIVRFAVLGRNEMHDDVTMSLYVELMGRYSNVIAVDAEGKITDAMRHIPPAENQLRAILPHLAYTLPPQTKIPPDDVDAIAAYLAGFAAGDLVKYLFAGVAGMVNITARELVARAGLTAPYSPLTTAQAQALAAVVKAAYETFGTPAFRPAYARDEMGEYIDYYIFPYRTTGYEMTETSTLNEAADLCHGQKDKALRLKASGKHLGAVIDNAIKKNEKLLAVAKQKLLDCERYEDLRVMGELITSNLYRLHKGDREAVVYDYYADEERTVPLDVMLSPAENAQAYYKRYAKQKRTVQVAEKQVVEYQSTLAYLQSVKTAFSLAEDAKDLTEIERELVQNGFLQASRDNKKVRTPAPEEPPRYVVDGFTVLRGKNNLQNERLTFHVAKENDIWLHVKASAGSHVVVLTEGKPLPDHVLETAAEIAAYYSDQKEGGKVAVDYAPRRYVKHHPAKKSGLVVYTDYQTITVTPKGHKEYETN
ncbi:MAG: NFACT family protein [Clostridia bacterium]|nr:NFACT family protein [Clostridia bacterium]